MTAKVEHEFRFGTVTDHMFSSRVPQNIYDYLYVKAKTLGAAFTPAVTYDVTYYENDQRYMNGVLETKTQTDRKDFFIGPFAIRYSKCTETSHGAQPEPPGGIRHRKTRISATINDTFRFDFSIVDGVVFQVEIEVLRDEEEDERTTELFQRICRWDYMPNVGLLPHSMQRHQQLIFEHNEHFGHRSRHPWYKMSRSRSVTVPLPEVSSYMLSYKYDGIRGLLRCGSGVSTYFVNHQGLLLLDMDVAAPCSFMFDVECWQGKFIVLDVLMADGVDVRGQALESRLAKYKHVHPLVELMQYSRMTKAALNDMWARVLNNPEQYDGLMLRNRFGRYAMDDSYKLKPLSKITIDLTVQPDGLYAYNKAEKKQQKWVGIEAVRGHVECNYIWEFQFYGPEHLVPVRKREDRKCPNSFDTIEQVLLTARNPWVISMLQERLP